MVVEDQEQLVQQQNNIDDANDLVLSQEGAPQTHRTMRQIAREPGIHFIVHKMCEKTTRA